MLNITLSDQEINELFSNTNFGDKINNCVKAKRQQINKTLTDLISGYWSGHTAYNIVLKGKLIIDSSKGTAKELTPLGLSFMNEFKK
jgi:hypothetical protein